MVDMTPSFENDIPRILRDILAGTTISSGCGSYLLCQKNDGILLSRATAQWLLARLEEREATGHQSFKIAVSHQDRADHYQAALTQVRGFAKVMGAHNWRDLRLHIERQCDVLNDHQQKEADDAQSR